MSASSSRYRLNAVTQRVREQIPGVRTAQAILIHYPTKKNEKKHPFYEFRFNGFTFSGYFANSYDARSKGWELYLNSLKMNTQC